MKRRYCTPLNWQPSDSECILEPVRRYGPYLLFLVLVLADQALKLWTVSHWQQMGWPSGPPGPTSPHLPVIPGFLDFVLTYNTGAAWSLFSGAALPLALLRIAVGIGILMYLWRMAQPLKTAHWTARAYPYVLAIIAVGAVGNAIDGLYQGKVTDMLYSYPLSWINQRINGQNFPIFNIADSCVVGGVIFLLLLSLLEGRKKTPPVVSSSSTPEEQR